MSEIAHTTPVRPPVSEEHRAEALRRVNRSPGQHWGLFLEWAKSFTIAIVLFLFVRTFLVEAFKIPSGSMERTLLVGDFLLVNKMVYGAEVPFTGKHLPAIRHPQRGDVIVFQWPVDPSKNFVKRLVGVPGDTLMMSSGDLYVNGVRQSERYVSHSEPPDIDPTSADFDWQKQYVVRTAEAATRTPPSRNNWGPIVVPKDEYFVLGDNRDNSLDSRYWKFVPDSLIRGRPMFVYYSYDPDSLDRMSWLTRIRWTRIGERVR
jgi:signal peptidase I